METKQQELERIEQRVKNDKSPEALKQSIKELGAFMEREFGTQRQSWGNAVVLDEEIPNCNDAEKLLEYLLMITTEKTQLEDALSSGAVDQYQAATPLAQRGVGAYTKTQELIKKRIISLTKK